MPMRIMMPLIVVIGYEQVMVIQVLMPLKKDKFVFYNAMSGAIIGLILNILLVPSLKSVGSSMVWFVSEIVVLLSSQYFVAKTIQISFPWRRLLEEVVIYIPIGILIFYLSNGLSIEITIMLGCGLMALSFLAKNWLIFPNEYMMKFVTHIVRTRNSHY